MNTITRVELTKVVTNMKSLIVGLMRNVIRACYRYKLNPDEIYLEAIEKS